jgi:cytidylate kinase
MKKPCTNITISGDVGVGKSTLRDNLKKILEPKGFKFYTTGLFFRKYTGENIQPTASLVTDSFDIKLEDFAKRTLENKTKLVFDAWLAGYVARGMEHVYKILVICSDYNIKTKRVAKRDGIDYDDAQANINERNIENVRKWKKLYGVEDFFYNKDYYNLIVDTAHSAPEETAAHAMNGIKKYVQDA